LGCDIHVYLEINVNGKWYYVGAIDSHRSYFVFNLLSGVRGDRETGICYMSETDSEVDECMLSPELKERLDIGKGDYHSLTIITLDTLEEVNKEITDTPNETEESADWKSKLYTYNWERIMRKLSIQEVVDDVRIVAFYDN